MLQHSRLFMKRNASIILTIAGGAGVIATSVMAVKATPKALQLIEKAKEEKQEDLTKLEVVKVAGPAYIPAAITGAATIACIFGANALNKRQQAGLMSAYALLDNSYKEYKRKVTELYGDDANNEIITEIAKDKYEEIDISVDEDKQLFYDDFSSRYFESTMIEVKHAEYMLNRKLAISDFACLNDFYNLLGIDEVDGGDELGWYGPKMTEVYWHAWVEFHHEKVVMDDGLTCYIITMPIEPATDYLD